MLQATKVRIYPTKKQEEFLSGQFGAVRFCFNKAVALKQRFYNRKGISLSVIHEIKPLLSIAKKSRKYAWLQNYDAMSLQEAVRHADTAFKKFFKHEARYPRFKSRRSVQSSYHCTALSVGDNWIKIPKCEPIKAVIHRPIKGKIKSITLTKDRVGDYFASILCETEEKEPARLTEGSESKVVGIDLGLLKYLTDSNGKEVENPKGLKQHLNKLRKLQKSVSRKQKGSHRRQKAVRRLSRLHRLIARKREDFQHKVSKRLIDESQAVIAESLKVKNMMHNRRLSRSIADAGWGGFLTKLKYKAERTGKVFLQVDTFYPSSKTCPQCLQKFEGLTLSMRKWTCPHCGRINPRDYTAALNIKRQGIVQLKAEGLSVLRR